MTFSPQDLDCPDPSRCEVLTAPVSFTIHKLPQGTTLFRVYDSTWGYDEPNPGFGDARFSPIDEPVSHGRLPSIYLAQTEIAALLETVFHEIHHTSSRTVYERELRGQLLAHVQIPKEASVLDMRDTELDRLGVMRGQVASSSAEHYPCTRRLATQLLAMHPDVHGFIWNSRQAELLGQNDVEVVVLFGADRFSASRGDWPLQGPGTRNLYEGPGRLLIDELAEELGATVELEAPPT